MEVKLPKLNELKVDWQGVTVELLGTFLFALGIGIVSLQYIEAESSQPASQLLAIFSPLVVGGLLALLVTIFAKFGVAHFNPAVSLANFVIGEISVVNWILYTITQVIGAVLGTRLAAAIFGGGKFGFGDPANIIKNVESVGLGAITIASLEAFGTFLLVSAVIYAVKAKVAPHMAGLVIGLALALAIFLTQQFTTGLINPAISLSYGMPAIYVFAPLLGGVFAALLHILLSVWKAR